MSKYVFEGHVIRLNKKDYEMLWDNYLATYSEPAYLRELCSLDDWLYANNQNKKNWFWVVTSILKKKNPVT